MALDYLMRKYRDEGALERRIEPRIGPEPAVPASEVFSPLADSACGMVKK